VAKIKLEDETMRISRFGVSLVRVCALGLASLWLLHELNSRLRRRSSPQSSRRGPGAPKSGGKGQTSGLGSLGGRFGGKRDEGVSGGSMDIDDKIKTGQG
jgi:hypothetical protein